MEEHRIVFLGTPDISAFVLKGLVENGFNIVGVVTKEDKIRGRNNKVEESPVAKMAHELSLPVHKPHKLNKDFEILKEWKPDLLLTFAYGQIISDEILSLGTYKPLNLHASLLPKYRGAAPIQYALRNGDTETGVSLMEMVHQLDAGDVYSRIITEIKPEDNYTTLSNRLAEDALKLAVDALPKYFKNELVPVKQDESLVSICPTIKKEEEHLNLYSDPTSFINQIRSLSLTPGAHLLFNDEIIKIYSASYYSDETGEVGKIVLAHKKQIILQLEKGRVLLTLLQRPGKKMMSASDFNNGVHNFEGSILK